MHAPWYRRSGPRSDRQDAMAITYYKRFRMEIDLDGSLAPPVLPPPFRWISWEESLVDQHAEVKYLSFRGEIDACVFPCLGDRYGCQRLMREIRRKPGFLAGATWLIACPAGYVGTVQGVMDRGPIGAIQNLGVVPSYRGLGLGLALVRQALEGVYQAGRRGGSRGVTAETSGAVRLYGSVGFRRAKTLYKAVDG